MARKLTISNALSPAAHPLTTPKGAAGYDNARENIDPHIKTKVLNSKEGSVETAPTNDNHIANKKYVDGQASGIDPNHTHSKLAASDGTPDPAVRVNADGYVGIGTTTPDAPLHVSHSGGNIIAKFTNTIGTYYLDGYTWSAPSSQIFTAKGYMQYNCSATQSHKWKVGGVNKMRLTKEGDVGIGTTTPSEKLDVVGNIAVNGTVDGIDIAGMSDFVILNSTHRNDDSGADHSTLVSAVSLNTAKITSKWEVDGTETQLIIADEMDMQSKKIINLTDPTANQDAATKKYVDDTTTTGLISSTAITLAEDRNDDVACLGGNEGIVICRLTKTSISQISGIVAPSSPVILVLMSAEHLTGSITVLNDNANSTAANRIYLKDETSHSVGYDGGIMLAYDFTRSRWLLMGAYS